MYTYVLNNPLNHTDPTGMLGCQVGDQKYTTCTITVVHDPKTSKGTLTVTGQNKGDKNPTVLLTTGVVVGGDGHLTPTGTFTASVWEKDHVSKLYGHAADTPWSKTVLGGNAFGPYQLHIWMHGGSLSTGRWGHDLCSDQDNSSKNVLSVQRFRPAPTFDLEPAQGHLASS